MPRSDFAFGISRQGMNSIAITVTDFANLAIFNIKKVDTQKSSRFVMVSDDETKSTNGRTNIAADKGYAIAERLRNSYELFLDDTRLPNRDEFRHVKTCIVARTVDAGRDIVQKMGMPKKIYIDCHLRREKAMDFVTWLSHWAGINCVVLHDDFEYFVHGYKTRDEELEIRQLMDGMIRDRAAR